MLAVQLIAIILLGTGGFLAAAGLLLLGARIARIERRTFAKALEATLIGTVALFAISFILGSVPVVGGQLGPVGGWLVAVLVTQAMFRTTFGKATLAEVFRWACLLVLLPVIPLIVVGLDYVLSCLE